MKWVTWHQSYGKSYVIYKMYLVATVIRTFTGQEVIFMKRSHSKMYLLTNLVKPIRTVIVCPLYNFLEYQSDPTMWSQLKNCLYILNVSYKSNNKSIVYWILSHPFSSHSHGWCQNCNKIITILHFDVCLTNCCDDNAFIWPHQMFRYENIIIIWWHS